MPLSGKIFLSNWIKKAAETVAPATVGGVETIEDSFKVFYLRIFSFENECFIPCEILS